MNIPVYECPADGCDWQLSQLDYERNRPPFRAKLTIDADGVPQLDMTAIVEANAKHVDRMLREHLETHDVFDWVKTVQRLNQDLAQTGTLWPLQHAVDHATRSSTASLSPADLDGVQGEPRVRVAICR